MKALPRMDLPPAPLLRAYADAAPTLERLGDHPELGPRVRAVLGARADWLNDAFLDAADEAAFRDRVVDFYRATVHPPLHGETLRRRSGLVRHGLAHLLRSPDPVPVRLERCLAPTGTYAVAGVGPAFWSAAAQALDPARWPAWTRGTLTGLGRLGLARWHASDGPAAVYAALGSVVRRLLKHEPSLTAPHLDHFLTLAGRMRGRDLWSGEDRPDPTTVRVRQVRSGRPLRQRLKERGQALAEAKARFEAGLRDHDFRAVAAALRLADPAGSRQWVPDAADDAVALLTWFGRLWAAEDPLELVGAFEREAPPGGGRWLAAAALQLRDARRFPPFDDASRAGLATIDDVGELSYPHYAEAVAALCGQYRIHPVEVPAVLAALADADRNPMASAPHVAVGFSGFCSDTFRFLSELATNNRRDWMERQRSRYRFAVREPLAELCRALAERYVEPVLRQGHGWDLETRPQSGRAMSSIVKNDYGKSVPYHDALWITFYRRDRGGKRDDVQLFVRLAADGLSYGMRLGREARAAGRQFRHAVQGHAEPLFQALAAGGALAHCRFGNAEQTDNAVVLKSAGELRAWAAGKSLVAAKHLAPNDPVLTSEELVGDVLLTFDRLLPAYACAVSDDPLPLLERRAGRAAGREADRDEVFVKATSLPESWLRRAVELLSLKRQLILQGVPGTGKTYVARHLARYLTGGREEAVRLVQFHPAYAYEEFVEGIKARTVEIDGRHEVTYPVEDGLLCTFAAEAARAPNESFVLVIDEINRGNLPRIFGEMLYLLEYRDQALTLPCSRRPFRLPANLYLLGTMNSADRSVALIDQALRRRFSFLDMPPDAAVLARWLEAHPPRGGEAFAAAVVRLFEGLNARLRADLGPERQVGHSYFMVPELEGDKLRAVWDHQISPLLDEYFAGQPGRAAAYDLAALLRGKPPKSAAPIKSKR